MPIQAILFDAYGTLFDVYSIADTAERLFPARGAALAALWRDKQIEYTRLRTLSSTYKPFWEVTQDALVFSCRKLGLDLDLDAQHALMSQYAHLTPFPENLGVLDRLAQRNLRLGILSNANPEMLEGIVKATGMGQHFALLLSCDAVRKFKTAPEVYQLGIDMLGLPARDVLFVSSNGWDVCGAAWFGYKTFWVNRAGAPMEELGVTPHGQGATLDDLLALVERGGADGPRPNGRP